MANNSYVVCHSGLDPESRVSCENRNPFLNGFLPPQERRLDSRWSLPRCRTGRE